MELLGIGARLISGGEAENYEKKRISEPTLKADVPYDVANAGDVTAFWETALNHRGVEELRAKRGRSPNAETDSKEQLRCGLMPMCPPGIGALARAGRLA